MTNMPNKKQPKPKTSTQHGAPFEEDLQESPQPADFDYDVLEEEWHDDDDNVSEINYDATSITEDEDDIFQGSLSPVDFFIPKTVVVEAPPPPGVEVHFEDESYIY